MRVQAIKAIYRLQTVDDPNDAVTQIFKFHLECDPSSLVRRAVLQSIARSHYTIPFILERLWDVNDRVRRSVFVRMSSLSVNMFKTEQRLTILEQGLLTSSEVVRNVSGNFLLVN